MKLLKNAKISLLSIVGLLIFVAHASAQSTQDSIMLRKIYNECMMNSNAYLHLEELCKEVGGRLAGSPQAAQAVEMYEKWGKTIPGVTVTKQACMVPHWVRGRAEQAIIYREGTSPIIMHPCALGNSVATPQKGIRAKVVEILRWSQLDSLGKAGQLRDKIVFYDRPMNPTFVDPGEAYGDAVDQRWGGASRAAKYGAVASVIRSVTHAYDAFPHTGVMGYEDSVKRIPAFALSTIDATLLAACIHGNPNLELYLWDECQMLGDVLSYNVIVEMKGSEHPEEIITVGGHLDSWDLAEGAHDDGTGVVQALEVIRIFQQLGIKPKRTIRAVAFMNEENGNRGGKAYAAAAKEKGEKHIAAIESDGGGFTPTGFSCSNGNRYQNALKHRWFGLLSAYGLRDFERIGGGTDISPLGRELGVNLFGLEVDAQRYFDYHHTANDVFENVNAREMNMGAAAMAMLVYLLSEDK